MKSRLSSVLIIASFGFALGQQQLLQTDQIVDGFRSVGNPSPYGDQRGLTYELEDQKAAYIADSIMLSNMLSFFDNDNKLVDESDIAYEKAIDNTSPLSTQEIKNRLEILDRKSPFNFEYNKQLERVIVHYLKDKRPFLERMMTLSQFYFPLFEQELDKSDLPIELKYLAIAESALNPKARSRVGARGLWQFMYATGRYFGLRVDNYIDERYDPIKSTQAAAKYLQQMYNTFDDWDLALAAYNSGPGNVNKARRRSGGYNNYWNLRNYLPRETANYVPLFIATMFAFEFSEDYGLHPQPYERNYFETDTVHIKSKLSFEHLSKALSMSIEELEILNPTYKRGVIPKNYNQNKPNILRLPKLKAGVFVSNEKEIYKLADASWNSREKQNPELQRAQPVRSRYRVRSGDYLGKIAQRYGVSISNLRRWNNLKSNTIRVGQSLVVYGKKTPSSSQRSVAQSGSVKKVHVVKEGESLWKIARMYKDISIDKLKIWNELKTTQIKPGMQLKVCQC